MARSAERIDPADGAVELIPGQVVPERVFAVNVRNSGVIAFIGRDGRPSDVYVAAGVVFPLRMNRILVDGTTAQHIRGLV